ncbi:MAG: hypothetical protein M1830_000191 [Pleopsidium flavum]|nr:MAG: hypothetical protein M1830_000191 [Pleopsidium flavum]
MSAEDLGERLLGEVEEESLDKLLNSLRTLDNPQSRLGIPAIDNLVDIFQYPRQQEPHNHQTPWDSPQRSAPAPPVAKRTAKAPVIELTSATPCSGTTHLLYYIMAVSILPDNYNGIRLQGKGGAVVVLDNLGNFNVQRLYQVIRHYIHNQVRAAAAADLRIAEPPEEDIDALIRSSLHHVHIFRPQSSASLLATLQTLPSYLLDSRQHFSGGRVLQAILIDGIGAFVWQDRMDEEIQRIDGNPNHNPPSNTYIRQYQDLIKTLRAIQQLSTCAIIATNWGLSPFPSSFSAPPAFRPHLPSTWSSFCTLKLVLQRASVTKFREGLSAEGGWREAKARQEVVEKGRFMGWVNWWGCEEWSQGVREGLEEVGEGFGLRIGGEGVEVDEGVCRWRRG